MGIVSYYDTWLLEGSEPDGYDEDTAPHGLCDFCEQPMDYGSDGEFCSRCGPLPHEALDIVASFTVVDGVVTEVAP